MSSLIVNRGSTVDFSLVWPDGAGGAANLGIYLGRRK